MNAEVTVMEQQRQDLAPVADVTPLAVLIRAIQDPTCDLARLERLMDLEARWRAAQNKQAYIRAFAQFKSNMPDVICDMVNKQYDSDYSSLANLVNTTNKVLGQFGLNARWDIDQTDGIKITCIMTHEVGHSESVLIKGPLDSSGQKNPLQQIKSTLTYLEGATFQAITGVVARSVCADDDANSAGKRNADKKEAAKPDGYDAWSDGLAAVVDEGKPRLMEVWKKSDMPLRVFMTKHEPARWTDMKREATKVTKEQAESK